MSMYVNLRRVAADALTAVMVRPETIRSLLDAPGPTLDLDKTWHGLHYLLTGSDWGGAPPLAFIAAGGEPVGEVDLGYGPARAFVPVQVKQLSAALDALAPEALRERFDPDEMMSLGIYPEIWDRDPAEDDTLGWLLEVYEPMRGFVRAAAAAGDGLLVWCW